MATSLQSLIQSASPGDTITVSAGTYDISGVTLPGNITLQASGNVTLVGDMTVGGSNTVISGFNFSGSTVDISETSGVTIKNCVFNDGQGAVVFSGTSNALIANNEFHNVSGNVLTGWGLDQSTISGNKFYDCTQAITLDFNDNHSQGRDITIADNYFSGSQRMDIEVGPEVAYTSNLTIKGNWSEGINGDENVSYSIVPLNGVNTHIEGNYAKGPGQGIGIELDGSGEITGNYIEGFWYGAVVYGSGFNVHDNAFVNDSIESVMNYNGGSGSVDHNQTTASGFPMPHQPGTGDASAPAPAPAAAPSVPVVTAALQNDTGASTTDHVTSNPALTGKADPNAVVHFTIDGKASSATATADDAGKWTFTPGGLADGSHTVVASETNSAGTGKATVSINLDKTAPAMTAKPASNTATTDPVVTGTGDAKATVHFTVDGKAISGTTTADANGAWSYTLSGLSAGQHAIVASETDLAGNAGKASTTVTVSDPATPAPSVPSAPTTSTTSGGYVDARDDVYKIAAGQQLWIASYYLTWNDIGPDGSGKNGGLSVDHVGAKSAQGFTVTFTNGTLVYKPPAGWNGTDSIDYTIKDASGHSDSAKVLVTVGTGVSSDPAQHTVPASPVVTAALLHDTGTSSTDHITSDPALTGNADPNATIHFSIDGTAVASTAKADANGHWSYTPAGLSDGTHTVVASETNAAGLTGSASTSFDLQTQTASDPQTHGSAPVFTGDVATSTEVTVSGTTGQAGDHVSIYYGPNLLGTDVTGSDGQFHITGDALDGVTHIYRAVATDSAGHAVDSAGAFILGSAGDNDLSGTSSADLIAGRGNHDAIMGEGGADKLIGGGGNDTFIYTSASDSTSAASDTITDFKHGSDKIDFTQIAGISATKGVPLFQGNISGSGDHTLNAHSIAFMEVGGQTVVLANTSGNAETVTSTDHHAADMKIVLTGVNLGLTGSDFHHA